MVFRVLALNFGEIAWVVSEFLSGKRVVAQYHS